MTESLRARLSTLGFSHGEVRLPGETAGAPFEGAITLERRADSWLVTTVDYGKHWVLQSATTRAVAEELLLQYLARSLPPIRAMTAGEIASRVAAVSPYYTSLFERAKAAGSAGVVFNMPPGVVLDRFGSLDGIHLYLIDTPWEHRSLPPYTLGSAGSAKAFVSASLIRVRATVTHPWFDSPGGGLRFTLQAPELGVRDYVVAGDLQQVERTS